MDAWLTSPCVTGVERSGTYDMEGVEEGDAPDPDDSMFDTPLKNFDAIPEPGVGLNDEVGDDFVDASYFTAPQSALPHSLPAHLHLDPVKMQQMRALFFAEGILELWTRVCLEPSRVFLV